MKATLHLLSGGAAQGLVKALQPMFAERTGAALQARFGAVGAMREALLAGAPCDVMIVTQVMVDALATGGRLRPGSAVALGRVRTGMAVPAGRARPDVATPETLKAALLAADAIHFPDPDRATAGIHFARVLRELGVFEYLAPRFRTAPNGATRCTNSPPVLPRSRSAARSSARSSPAPVSSPRACCPAASSSPPSTPRPVPPTRARPNWRRASSRCWPVAMPRQPDAPPASRPHDGRPDPADISPYRRMTLAEVTASHDGRPTPPTLHPHRNPKESSMKPWLKNVLACALAAAAAGCMSPGATMGPGALPPAAGAMQGKVQVLWLGQSAFRFTSVAGKVIVIDPWLVTNPKTPEAYKKLEALGKVDLVLVTHGHFDHVADAAPLARLNNAPLWAPAGLAQSMGVLGMLPVSQANRINRSGSVTPLGPGIRITLVHAEHSSELAWKNPATDKDEVHVGGEPGGFIIEFENGFRIWHMGDTGVFGDMRLIAEMYKPDLVLMPIGGGQFVMNPDDAAMVVREFIKPKAVIPMHYLTNPGLPGTPAEFVRALGGAPVKVMTLQPGETAEF